MAQIFVNFKKQMGKIKPMHAVNNGPVCVVGNISQGWGDDDPNKYSNLQAFRDAGIPYARTHDSSFYPRYGLEHTVDVAFIFPNFDADVNDPASYDFACTDNYMQMIEAAGTKVFYRLGHRIEHEVKKYGTLPPKDFGKWAEICEHIIRHYTEGWADGFRMDIEYWEIWNEPDLDPDDSPNKRTWGGTQAEFFEFYHVVATHLKKCFPHLKIGGPAAAGKMPWMEEFLAQLKAPLDFFSWHVYAHTVEKVRDRAKLVRGLLDKYGFEKAESILNEWNYVSEWDTPALRYSHKMQQGLKGAAFNAAVMTACQQEGVDMLMYYDAQPTSWNGLFEQYALDHCYKGYFALYAFNSLYRLGSEVKVETVGDCGYALAARGEDEAAVLLCHYDDNDEAAPRAFTVDLCGFAGENGTQMEVYVLDEAHDLTLDSKMTFRGDDFTWEKELPVHACYLLKLKKITD